tara:strand:+ start:281 stop:2257 length:1977 start_codon:yes stop_codon:yes gene_type:complete
MPRYVFDANALIRFEALKCGAKDKDSLIQDALRDTLGGVNLTINHINAGKAVRTTHVSEYHEAFEKDDKAIKSNKAIVLHELYTAHINNPALADLVQSYINQSTRGNPNTTICKWANLFLGQKDIGALFERSSKDSDTTSVGGISLAEAGLFCINTPDLVETYNIEAINDHEASITHVGKLFTLVNDNGVDSEKFTSDEPITFTSTIKLSIIDGVETATFEHFSIEYNGDEPHFIALVESMQQYFYALELLNQPYSVENKQPIIDALVTAKVNADHAGFLTGKTSSEKELLAEFEVDTLTEAETLKKGYLNGEEIQRSDNPQDSDVYRRLDEKLKKLLDQNKADIIRAEIKLAHLRNGRNQDGTIRKVRNKEGKLVKDEGLSVALLYRELEAAEAELKAAKAEVAGTQPDASALPQHTVTAAGAAREIEAAASTQLSEVESQTRQMLDSLALKDETQIPTASHAQSTRAPERERTRTKTPLELESGKGLKRKPGFFSRHWKAIAVGTLVGLATVALGAFSFGILPAVIAGTFGVTGYAILGATTAGAMLVGAGTSAALDKLDRPEPNNVTTFDDDADTDQDAAGQASTATIAQGLGMSPPRMTGRLTFDEEPTNLTEAADVATRKPPASRPIPIPTPRKEKETPEASSFEPGSPPRLG